MFVILRLNITKAHIFLIGQIQEQDFNIKVNVKKQK